MMCTSLMDHSGAVNQFYHYLLTSYLRNIGLVREKMVKCQPLLQQCTAVGHARRTYCVCAVTVMLHRHPSFHSFSNCSHYTAQARGVESGSRGFAEKGIYILD